MELIYRNLIISLFCGLLFGLAWWLMIDISALYHEVRTHRHGILFLPIILSTLSLFVNSVVPNSSLVDVSSLTKRIFVHRLIFFLSTAVGFGGFLSAVIICVMKEASALPLYALIGTPLVNGFILICNFTFKFGIIDEEDYFV